jgi:outer membrane protein assembly factor BamD
MLLYISSFLHPVTRCARLAAFGWVMLALSLASCAQKPKEAVVEIERPPETLYNEAMDEIARKRFIPAAEAFAEVDRQHPYSLWARRAQLMGAYAYYEELDYNKALTALDRFIELYPGAEDISYAYYLRALCYYEQISDVRRDQRTTQNALAALQDIVTRYPDSAYARDARLKIDLTRDHLAGKDMQIGRYYLSQQQYQAAIGRFRTVVDTYQTTSHVPEALHRLTEAYLALGLQDEAQKAAAILGHNFPGSEWYQDSYALLVDPKQRTEPTEGVFSRALNSLFQ